MSLTELGQRTSGPPWLGSWKPWGLAALALLGAAPAQASALHRNRLPVAPSWLQNDPAALRWYVGLRAPHQSAAWWNQSLTTQQQEAFNDVLNESSAANRYAWLLHLRLPSGIHLKLVNGLLPETPLVEYLTWRRSFDPPRFDHYHPNAGPLIAQDLVNDKDPPGEGETITPPPDNPHTVVSEPSAALLGIALAGAAGWLRRRALARS